MPDTFRRRTMIVLQLVLGGILLVAALAKLTSPWMSFALSVDSYQILPDWAVLLIARFLPWFELLLGLALISGFGIRWTGALTTILLLLFFAVVVRSYRNGLTIDCGCFGPGEKLDAMTLVRDGSFVAMSILLTVFAFWPARRRA